MTSKTYSLKGIPHLELDIVGTKLRQFRFRSWPGLTLDEPLDVSEKLQLEKCSTKDEIPPPPEDLDIPLGTLPGGQRKLPVLLGHVAVEARGVQLVLRVKRQKKKAWAELVSKQSGEQPHELAVYFNLFFKASKSIEVGIPFLEPDGKASASADYAWSFVLEQRAAEVVLATWQNDAEPVLSLLKGFGEPKADSAEKTVNRVLQIFKGVQLNGLPKAALLDDVEFEKPTFELTKEGLRITNLDARINVGENPVELKGGELELDEQFRTKGDVPLVRFTAKEEKWLFAGTSSLLTLQIHRDATFCMCLDPGKAYIAMESGQDGPVATLFAPGIEKNPPKKVEDRFVLDVLGETSDRRCRLTPGGLQLTAAVRPTSMNFGSRDSALIRDVQLERGQCTIVNGDYTLDIQASGRLAYFERASGKVTVRASNGSSAPWNLSVRFDPQLEASWTDPTGYLIVNNPSAWVSVEFKGGNWQVDGAVSGNVSLAGNPSWGDGSSQQWLSELFADLSFDFEELKLSALLDLIDGGKPEGLKESIKLNIPTGSIPQINLWEILKFDLTEFRIGFRLIEIGGRIHIGMDGGVSFVGRIPRMRIELKPVKIGVCGDQPLTLEGHMQTQSGFKAALTLTREEEKASEALAGTGMLAIPGMPEVSIACRFGRRQLSDAGRTKWIPLFFLFVQADYPVTLYPGVVLRMLGLGFGVNQKLRGLDSLMEEGGVRSLVEDPRGLPNPADIDAWVPGGDWDTTDISLVAHTYIAPAQKEDGPFAYVGDALFYLQPTSTLTIAFCTNLWLFTSLTDAQKDEFRRRPVMAGTMVLYPRHAYLEMLVQSEKNPKMSAAPEAYAKALSIAQAEVYMKATPDMFRMRVGPVRVETKEHGFHLKGSLLYAVEASSKAAVMLSHMSVAGQFSAEVHERYDLDPLCVAADVIVRAKLAYEALLAGGYLGESQGVLFYGRLLVHISAELEVRVSLDFHLVIKVWRFKQTISWSKRMSASLGLAFDADVEALLGTKGVAFQGRGTLRFNVLGYHFSPSINVKAGDYDRIPQARAKLAHLLPR